MSGAGKNALFLLFVAAVVGVLYLLSGQAERPSPLPADPDHRVASNEECAPCHGPGSPDPLSDAHPPKPQCLTCHMPP